MAGSYSHGRIRKRTLQQIEADGHRFMPIHYAPGNSAPRCECLHDFGRVGGTMADCRKIHRDHLREVQASERAR